MAGAEIKISRPVEDKNPVVIARLGRDEKKRTVTFYGHYDVQPAMEREWTTDPFEMNAIDGYYYGRGTSDNKVQLSPFQPSPGTLQFYEHTVLESTDYPFHNVHCCFEKFWTHSWHCQVIFGADTLAAGSICDSCVADAEVLMQHVRLLSAQHNSLLFCARQAHYLVWSGPVCALLTVPGFGLTGISCLNETVSART